ncbi:MAG: adenylate/guanylate cyclase domain-containing protein [Reyranellaceae bacterium]
MGRISRRNALAGLVVALVAATAVASPAFDALRGLSIDVLTSLRWRVFGQAYQPTSSPTVVIAVDEETYRTKPFDGTPIVTWTAEIGRVLSAVIESQAKIVGFDVVFPTSIEQSEVRFGEETLGARVRGFDRDFLRALALAARSDKVVLGQVQHSDHPILPAPGQRVAVGQQRNIRALNVHNDPDDVVRRIPLTFSVDGVIVPSMAVELAGRALGTAPEIGVDNTVRLASYRIPANVPNTLTLNFEGGGDDVPTFSLADLRTCLEKGDKEFFNRHFAGRVVLIGTVLDVEDRKLTSKRFATAAAVSPGPRCAIAAPAQASRLARVTIPGVYIHATAVNNLLRRNALAELGSIGGGLIAFAFAAVIVAAALMLAPANAALVFVGMTLAWLAAAIVVFGQAVALPVVEPAAAGLIALGLTVGYRLVIADKDKRFLRKSFALYLAPSVIEKMVATNRPPVLGGETRDVTIFFSDVAGFSSLSETMTPAEVVALMNDYLSAMTDIIEAQGGFVDKYIGDAIVAIFGAPLDDRDHARHAVAAALACRRRLEELNATASAFKGRALGQRIGLNSGAALVGNIGSRRRFNYTVMGDAVNLAARLEGANKYFGTSIMASEMTVALAGEAFEWRELDAVRVKGRVQPVRVFEPLGEAGAVTAELRGRAEAYAKGLQSWRSADFVAARDCFARFAESDRPSALFLARAQQSIVDPPGPDWQPVNTLDEK